MANARRYAQTLTVPSVQCEGTGEKSACSYTHDRIPLPYVNRWTVVDGGQRQGTRHFFVGEAYVRKTWNCEL